MNTLDSPCFFGVPNNKDDCQISFEITNKCNLHCKHCMNKSDNCRNTVVGLSWDEMSQLLEEMKSNNVKELYISGGEPTMYPYFNELVKKSKKLGFETLLATNAYDIEEFIDVIKENVDIVFVSLDGTEKVHDTFRGQPGAYKKTVSNIKKMLELGIPVRISTAVSKENIFSIEDLIREVRKLGVFQIHLTIFVSVGRAVEGLQSIDVGEYYEIVDMLHSLRKTYSDIGFTVTMRRDGKLDAKTEKCYGGERMAHITAAGIVAPCSYVAKSNLADKYCMQWKPGHLTTCINKVKTFQNLCDEREKLFGHTSCAALATMNNKTDPFGKDPLDVIFKND